MLKRLNVIFEKARKVEAALASTVEGASGRVVGASPGRQPLEVVRAVVDAVARDIQPAGRGQNGFPFNHVLVTLLAPTARAKAQLQAVVDGSDPLPKRIEARLRAGGCQVAGLSVKIVYVSKARLDWAQPDFDVECRRLDPTESVPATTQPRLELVVAAGAAGKTAWTFSMPVVALGRGGEICDSRGRLIRVNHLAFIDGDDEINQSVSRLHAHIEYDPASGSYRVFDDGSAQGTNVIRQGRGYVVSRGTRGLTLAAGDELVLGRARVKVKISR